MARVVIISHPSEVIRNGFLSILENEISSKIICIEKFNELKEHHFINYSEMVILFPLEENHMELINLFKGRSNRIILIAVKLSETHNKPEHIDYIYNINSPAEELIQKLKHYINKDDNAETDEELTIREKEVLRLIALGHTNKSIADTLFISTHTVISHRKNITDKLGIKSIPGLTVYAIMQKIISQADVAKGQLN